MTSCIIGVWPGFYGAYNLNSSGLLTILFERLWTEFCRVSGKSLGVSLCGMEA